MSAAVDLRIEGMTCQGCVNAVTKALKRVAPAARIDVDLAAGRASIVGPAPPAGELATAVRDAGFAVTDAQ